MLHDALGELKGPSMMHGYFDVAIPAAPSQLRTPYLESFGFVFTPFAQRVKNGGEVIKSYVLHDAKHPPFAFQLAMLGYFDTLLQRETGQKQK